MAGVLRTSHPTIRVPVLTELSIPMRLLPEVGRQPLENTFALTASQLTAEENWMPLTVLAQVTSPDATELVSPLNSSPVPLPYVWAALTALPLPFTRVIPAWRLPL